MATIINRSTKPNDVVVNEVLHNLNLGRHGYPNTICCGTICSSNTSTIPVVNITSLIVANITFIRVCCAFFSLKLLFLIIKFDHFSFAL